MSERALLSRYAAIKAAGGFRETFTRITCACGRHFDRELGYPEGRRRRETIRMRIEAVEHVCENEAPNA